MRGSLASTAILLSAPYFSHFLPPWVTCTHHSFTMGRPNPTSRGRPRLTLCMGSQKAGRREVSRGHNYVYITHFKGSREGLSCVFCRFLTLCWVREGQVRLGHIFRVCVCVFGIWVTKSSIFRVLSLFSSIVRHSRSPKWRSILKSHKYNKI